MDEGHSRQQSFPTTQWSLIIRAAAEDPAERERALQEICTLYWPPVFAFIRSRGYSPHDAEDLTQSFFARLLERNDFARAEARLGKLRSYLLRSVQHFLASDHRQWQTLKRGGKAVLLSLDVSRMEELPFPEPVEAWTPERIYERQWAMTLMEGVVRTLEARYAEKGQAELFAALKPCLVVTEENGSAVEKARRLGLTEQVVRVKLHRLRQRYAETLRETVRATLGNEAEVEEEIRHLISAFS